MADVGTDLARASCFPSAPQSPSLNNTDLGSPSAASSWFPGPLPPQSLEAVEGQAASPLTPLRLVLKAQLSQALEDLGVQKQRADMVSPRDACRGLRGQRGPGASGAGRSPVPTVTSPAGAACGPGSRGPCRQSTAGNGVRFGPCREAGTAAARGHDLPPVGRCHPQAVTRPGPGCVWPACLCAHAGPLWGPLLRPVARAGAGSVQSARPPRGTDGRCGRSFVLCTLQPAVSEGRGLW